MSKVGVGIIGAGHAGSIHAQVLSADNRVKLIGLADSNKSTAEALAARHGTEPFDNYKALIDEGSLEAVFITSPNALHADHALYAIQHGKHVFSEKPMATSVGDAKRIIDAIKKHDVKYQVGHNRRFWPVYKKVKSMIETRSLKPYMASARIIRGELKRPSWVGDPKVSGGFIYESIIHVLDALRWLMGDVTEIFAFGKANVYESQVNDILMLLKFKEDAFASLTCSGHTSWIAPVERVELYGDHSCVVIEEPWKFAHSPGLDSEIVTYDFSQLSRETTGWGWGFAEEDKHFIDSIVNDAKTVVDEMEGYRAVEIGEACYRSISSNRPVQLPL
jgi:myo-inositol 2-dehydrogenase/D-chiro-inositol 1-dehydrogenase